MSSERSVHRRVLRRETHSSRAGAAITVAVCLILLFAAVGAACVYLVVHPATATAVQAGFSELARFRSALRPGVLVGGVVTALLGLIVILLGVTPGRKARRRLASDRSAIVVDDKVIANALAARAASVAGVAPGQAKVIVGRRRVAVRLVPTSGTSLDTKAVADAVAQNADAYGLTRAPRVHVAENGVVGS